MPLILIIILALFIIFNIAKDLYTEWLWFSSLKYGSVYATVLKTRAIVFFLSAISFAIIFLGNLGLAVRLVPKTEARYWPWDIMRRLQAMLRTSVIAATVLLSLIFGLVAQSKWEIILRFLNQQPFGITDPVFHREVSFYVFSLPFLNLLQGWLLWALIVTLVCSAGVYLLSYGLQWFKFHLTRPVLAHISGLVVAILGLLAWGYWLSIWELVFSNRGVVFGASFADLHAKLPAQWILIAVVIISIGVILFSVWRHNFRWPLYAIGWWLAAAVLIGNIYPAVVQRFQVEPDELERETPYINYNIDYTRRAFALDRIEEQPFPAEDTPSPQDIADNEQTVNNIRLWDTRPLKDTYNQIQSIRLYYDFVDIDVDRYTIDGQYRQVMLSARELSAEKLAGQAQTWLNRKLQFTHGYGLALSPVNEITSQGLPDLFLKDIPPVGKLTLDVPQIYFGEKTDDYIMVKTKTQEFDHPSGEDNVYGFYQGKDGVGLGSFFRRFVYAWELGDFNILISNQLTQESRVLYYRNIQSRVSHLAPFLTLDKDPYPVVIDGKLLWIQDAYTTSDRYPYSTPAASGINYIRNSVKAVVDAYNGDVTFYIADPEDALIRTYQKIFPVLFVPFTQMPESLRVHLRYPEDMFVIQSEAYRSYHMRDARVFYNKEDLWAIPREVYFGTEQAMDPYYIIMRLPGEQGEEFLLMLPFTPVNKNNTIGWLAARSDGASYGKLLAYLFPKDRLVYGPSQVENRIGQDTIITSQFALWGRGGSRIIRGNLLLIPLARSMLYVEPVFLQAEVGGLPELKRVIVVAGEQIAMQPTLKEALAAIFGTPTAPAEPAVTPPSGTVPASMTDLINQAQQHYVQALEYQKAGDWAGYGKELASLQTVLEQLATLAGK
ncbi:MAG: hypothetical protein A2Z28_04330 [Chloroflexi bacterium RBG_16_51_9]|nr:MAG: hypothetical protein A2Z28_04330 [Chloroflexi bacterium RBG_16_51_9]